ncbi:MAG: hypothetical protein ACYCTV_09650 [Leptospirales bacterium]
MDRTDEEKHELEFVSTDRDGYVIIRYNNLYIGIARSDLKIDPFLEYLGDCFLSPRILIAHDLNILDQRMKDARIVRETSEKN